MAFDNTDQNKMLAKQLSGKFSNDSNSSDKKENSLPKEENIDDGVDSGTSTFSVPKRSKAKKEYVEATTCTFYPSIKKQLLRQAKKYGYVSKNGKPNMSQWITALSNAVEETDKNDN